MHVPHRYPTAVFFLDESGSRASGHHSFVIGGVKVRSPGQLRRSIDVVRDRNQFRGEFKFSEITKGSVCAYYDLIDVLSGSDAHLCATIDEEASRQGVAPWQRHVEVASRLIIGNTNRRELVTVVSDGMSTPPDVHYEDLLREKVNKSFKGTSVVSALCCDSKTHDVLQLADLVASAIGFDRRARAGVSGRTKPSTSSPKAQVARRLMDTFDLSDFSDQRSSRVNIATLQPRTVPVLRSVGQTSA